MSALLALWSQRTQRERLLLGGLAALILVLAYVGLGLAPLRAGTGKAQARLDRAVGDLLSVRSMAPGVATSAGPADQGALRAIVAETAAKAGLAIARAAPEGERALTLTLEEAGSRAVFGWLHALETEHGVVIERVAAQPGAQETLAVQVTVAAP